MASTIGGRYILDEVLGTGGAGVVYRATDRLSGAIVALKRVALPTGLAATPSGYDTAQAGALRLALANEFQTLASLHHPNIIGVLDYGFASQFPMAEREPGDGTPSSQPYFTMEYLANSRTILEAGAALPVGDRVALLIQVLQALAYVHRRGILHRDLKPGNVLIVADATSGATARVLDFGLSIGRSHHLRAGVRAAQGEQGADTDDGSTRAGVVGTIAYMAPEVLTGQPAEEAADLYAVGVIAYELFAGRHPYDISSLYRLLDGILSTRPDLSALNLPNQLVQVIGRLLAKEPQERYPSAEACIAALCHALGQPPPPESAAIRESYLQAARFVGRGAELQQLTAALRQAMAAEPQGSAWLVGGESGVGKTRLLDELRTRALVAGALVLRGQGVREGSVPFQLWREPLRRLALSTEMSDLEAAILKPVVPDIEALRGRPVPDAPPMFDQAGQQRLLNTIASIFRRQASPVLLILDDLQWASESLDMLSHLVPTIGRQPLLVAASYRDDEAPHLPAALPGAHVIKLDRLSSGDVSELSASMLGEVGRQAGVATLLQRESEGNTFFLIEVTRALAAEAGRLSAIGQGALPLRVFPQGVQTIIARKLEQVPLAAQWLLQAAAVAGREVDLTIMAELLAGAEPPDRLPLGDWLTACAGASVLELREGAWRFVHNKLRDGILAALLADENRRADLHRRVAEAIERAYPDSSDRSTALAYHWGQAGDRDRERHYARLAGVEAARRFANADAVAYLTLALDLSYEADAAGCYALLLARERVYDRQGNRQGQAQDLADLQRLSTVLDDPARQAEVALRRANYAEATSDYDGMVAAAQEAIALARRAGDQGSEAHGHLWWGRALWYQGNQDAARPIVERALVLARAAGRRVVEADTVRTLALVSGAQGDFAARRHYLAESLALHREVGDRRGEGIVFNNLGDLCRSLGDYAGAREQFHDSLRILHEIGSRWVENIALYNLGITCNALGDYETGRDYLEQSLELSRDIGDRRFEGYALTGLGDALLGLGASAAAVESYRLAIDIRRGLGQPHLVVESLAYLARALLLQAGLPGEASGSRLLRGQALSLIAEVLGYVDSGGSLEGTEEPLRIYLVCFEVLGACGDPRAAEILRAANRSLHERAARIPDEEGRRSFLENVPYHRQIAELAAAGSQPL